MIVFAYAKKKNETFDPRRHIQTKSMLKLLTQFEADLVCIHGNDLIRYRITLKPDVVPVKTMEQSSGPDDIIQWFWDLDDNKWLKVDLCDAKYFEADLES